MKLRQSLRESQKVKVLFYVLSIVILIMTIVDISLQNLSTSDLIKGLDFKNIYFLDSFILFLSVVTFILGLFVQKNWIVWTILALLLAPNIFVFVVFLGLSSLNIFKAIYSYFYAIMAWFFNLINVF